MSEIRVENIIGETGVDAVQFTKGINVTGIVTATNVSIGSSVTATNFFGSGANLTGITQADPYAYSTWYLASSDYTAPAANQILPIWTESNGEGYERLGTAPTYNAGAFTLPSTGYWRVSCTLVYYHTTATGDSGSFSIRRSQDSGSSYNNVSNVGFRINGDTANNNAKMGWTINATVKISNASTNRIGIWGFGINTSVGRFMSGSNADSAEGGGCQLHIEKMANL
tara:strand:- start:68 stop:745 length:678 start_codon:yes stop_codon:yes gene_type:complete